MEKSEPIKYYNVSLNYNIFRAGRDISCDGWLTNEYCPDKEQHNSKGRNSSHSESIPVNETEKFKTPGMVKVQNGLSWLIGIYDEVPGYVTLDKVAIICYEKNRELYDIVTGIKIPYSLTPENYDCITHYNIHEWPETKIAEELNKLASCKTNIENYKKRLQIIRQIAHQNYLESINNTNQKKAELIRSRKYIEDFQKKYGK